MQADGETLKNNQTGELLKPNMDVGFYKRWMKQATLLATPSLQVLWWQIGTDNFERVWKDDGIKEPFISIFIWTVVFSILT